jgi:hypothetical protein
MLPHFSILCDSSETMNLVPVYLVEWVLIKRFKKLNRVCTFSTLMAATMSSFWPPVIFLVCIKCIKGYWTLYAIQLMPSNWPAKKLTNLWPGSVSKQGLVTDCFHELNLLQKQVSECTPDNRTQIQVILTIQIHLRPPWFRN